MRFGHTYPIPANVLRGVVPVASGFDVDPTNLSNCTDGDVSSVTGTGTKAILGAGYYGQLVFDLGSIKTVLVSGIFGLWSTANAVQAHLSVSDDNISYSGVVSMNDSNTAAAESVRHTQGVVCTGRYLKVSFYCTGAATGSVKIYEVMAWQLNL